MLVQLVVIDRTLTIKNQPSLTLDKEFTANHQINSVIVDSKKQEAIFVIHSNNMDNNEH